MRLKKKLKADFCFCFFRGLSVGTPSPHSGCTTKKQQHKKQVFSYIVIKRKRQNFLKRIRRTFLFSLLIFKVGWLVYKYWCIVSSAFERCVMDWCFCNKNISVTSKLCMFVGSNYILFSLFIINISDSI